MGKIIGIDPSLTATGICIVDVKVTTTVVAPHVSVVKEHGGKIDRLGWFFTHFDELFDGEVDGIALEGYAMGSKWQTHQMGELGGVIRLAVWNNGAKLWVIPPTTLKKFATGKGNASKPDMAVAAYKRWSFEGKDDNAVDAYALAMAGLVLSGRESEVPGEVMEFQRKALVGIKPTLR